MKKVLALVLVAVLAIGMGSAAFANLIPAVTDFTKVKDFYLNYELRDGIDAFSGTGYSNRTYNMNTVYPMDKPTLKINLWTWMFGDNNEGVTNTNLVYTVDVAKLVADNKLQGTVQYPVPSNVNTWAGLIDTLAAKNPSSLLIPVNFGAYAQANNLGVTDAQVAYAFAQYYANEGYITYGSSGIAMPAALGFNGAYSGSMVYGTSSVNNNRVLTANELHKSKFEVGTTVRGDSGLIKSLELDYSAGQIVLKVIDEFVSTGSADLEVLIYLIIDGKRFDNKGVTVLATVENPIIEVYANHDRVDISKGYVAKAIEFNPKIAVYLGNGVTLHTKFFKDKKYYGIATRDSDQEAERVFRQYKDVDNVLTLKTVGLNNAGDYITLSTDYAGYYVYDKDMNYLGKGDEQLKPFSSKLYLSYNKLEVEEEEEEETEAPAPSTPSNPETGGNGQAANNTNMNPGTGR